MILSSPKKLQHRFRNIGEFVLHSAISHPKRAALMVKDSEHFSTLNWSQLLDQILRIHTFFSHSGARRGQKVAFCCENSPQMLSCELALMSVGMIHVPLYFGYKRKRVQELLGFTNADFLVVSSEEQLRKIDPDNGFRKILCFETVRSPQLLADFGTQLVFYDDLIQGDPEENSLATFEKCIAGTNRLDTCLIMYTSGTMGFPKGVQLCHGNILSQQEALSQLWDVKPGKRILSFLPWHHSFGGIFEKYFALYSGTCLVLDDSKGKDIRLLLDNWKQIQPHYFFSIPKVFKELVTQTQIDPDLEKIVFRSGLEFVFTAGAPLEAAVAQVFREKQIPVLEGWGLTETSPCCTLTTGNEERRPGIVGKPIPGVEIKLSDEAELLINGPNVMSGYFGNSEESARSFDENGWFKTGDLGELVNGEVKIITRKDRIFKLASAEKVNPTAIENTLMGHCQLVKHALVFGTGMEKVCAMLFPNKEGLTGQSSKNIKGCAHPNNNRSLSHCLNRCIGDINRELTRRYEKICTFVLIDHELEIEKGELTPSMKINPRTVYDNYQQYVPPMFDPDLPRPTDAIYIEVEN